MNTIYGINNHIEKEKMKMKITGIKQAVGEYKNWIKRDWSYVGYIVMDVDRGEVWADCFTSTQEWREYHSIRVIDLTYILKECYIDVSMKAVRKVAEIAMSYNQIDNWDVYDIEHEVISDVQKIARNLC